MVNLRSQWYTDQRIDEVSRIRVAKNALYVIYWAPLLQSQLEEVKGGLVLTKEEISANDKACAAVRMENVQAFRPQAKGGLRNKERRVERTAAIGLRGISQRGLLSLDESILINRSALLCSVCNSHFQKPQYIVHHLGNPHLIVAFFVVDEETHDV